MKLKEGNFYKNRKGEKIGPLKPYQHGFSNASFTDGDWTYLDNGLWAGVGDTTKDLIEEWREEKGIFTTVKKLNIGDFGTFKVNEAPYGINVELFPSSFWKCNSEELKQLAKQLLEIVDHWENDGE